MPKWEAVGEAGVDSGTVWVGDPGYLVTDDEEWVEFAGGKGEPEVEKTGVASKRDGIWIGNFGGDGQFPVYVQRDAQGYVTAAMIRFDGEEPADG